MILLFSASCALFFGVIFFSVNITFTQFENCGQYNDMCVAWKAKPCCDPEMECKAQSPYGIFHCLEKDQLGRYCANQNDCARLKHVRCSAINKCVCAKNHVPVNSTTCLPNLGEFCHGEECFSANSHCIDNRCQCKEEYSPYGMKLCLPLNTNNTVESKRELCAPLFGGFCTSDSECTSINFACIDYKCQCRYGLSEYTKQWCHQPFHTIDCQDDYQCSIPVKNSICENKCTCLPNYHLKNEACLPGTGHYCADEPCAADNSDCIDHKCQCKYGYAFYYDTCMLVNVNILCSIDADCDGVGNAVCLNNRCMCKRDYALNHQNLCVSIQENFCFSTDQCKIINSECIDNECKCGSDTLVNDTSCLPTKLGQFCTGETQCQQMKNAKCSRMQRCVCKSTFFPFNSTTCGSLLGGFCSDKSDCPLLNFDCIDNKCQCSPGFLPLSSSDCVNEHVAIVCNRQKLSTPFLQNTTLLARHLGSYCIHKTYCNIPNSDCIDNKCQCTPNFVSSSNNCVPPTLGHPCKKNFDCQYIKNSQCSPDEFCACIDHYFGFSKYQCVPTLGGQCSNNSDCYAYGSNCIDNYCQCKANYSAVSDSQCKLTSSLVTCNHALECGEPWNAVCTVDQTCVCLHKNFLMNQWTCQPVLGGSCWYDHQCITKNSRCLDYYCRCSEFFTRVSDNQCISTLSPDSPSI